MFRIVIITADCEIDDQDIPEIGCKSHGHVLQNTFEEINILAVHSKPFTVLNGFIWSGDEVQFFHFRKSFYSSQVLFDVSSLSISRISSIWTVWITFNQILCSPGNPDASDHHLGPIRFHKNYVFFSFLFIPAVVSFLWAI